jgi:hypothetical protein
MTVGAHHSQVFERVVCSIAILVVKLKRELLAIPERTKSTFFAFLFLQASCQEFPLDCFATRCRVGGVSWIRTSASYETALQAVGISHSPMTPKNLVNKRRCRNKVPSRIQARDRTENSSLRLRIINIKRSTIFQCTSSASIVLAGHHSGWD